MPAAILGGVYERFLGKTIRLTAGHQAKVEEKPEVRKAGGVYYTPKYIVDYIVENTLGKLLEGKTPKDVEKLRICDPACGSGSFLIGAYQYLLDWHLRFYTSPPLLSGSPHPLPLSDSPHPQPLSSRRGENDDTTTPPLLQERGPGGEVRQPRGEERQPWSEVRQSGGEVRQRKGMKIGEVLTPDGNLTTALKKRILLNNIYGVDIDPQAVEVTKLNLLLKALEGETQASINQQMTLFHERVLPNLSHNIQCGNSLIGPDFYDNQFDLFPDQMKKINAFDWHRAFPEVFEGGGFDAVIGNPPYVVLSTEIHNPQEIEYVKRFLVSNYKIDLYHLFLEKGVTILKENGRLGFIVPSNWLTQKFTKPLRKFILEHAHIEISLLFEYLVFDAANVFTQILVLKKPLRPKESNIMKIISVKNFEQFEHINEGNWSHIEQQTAFATEDLIIESRQFDKIGYIVNRIIRENPKLVIVARASLGCQAYNSIKHRPDQIKNRVFHSEEKLSEEYLPELAGRDVGRYTLNRVKGKWIKYGPWLHDYRTTDWLTGPRILIREITGGPGQRLQATYTEETYCNYKTILNVSPSKNTVFSMKYLCGLLNSRLMSIIFERSSNKIVANAFPRLSVGDLKNLPIKNIDFNIKSEKAVHDKISEIVDNLLRLYNTISSIPLETDRQQLQRAIDHAERRIDELVYELYRLSEEEIAIIEH